jgi:hypothetical protein
MDGLKHQADLPVAVPTGFLAGQHRVSADNTPEQPLDQQMAGFDVAVGLELYPTGQDRLGTVP